MHVGDGVCRWHLVIQIPPKEVRAQAPKGRRHLGHVEIVVDRIVFDESKLVIGTLKPDKDPQDYELSHVVLRDVGPAEAVGLRCDAGECDSEGRYSGDGKPLGRGTTNSPSDSTVTEALHIRSCGPEHD